MAAYEAWKDGEAKIFAKLKTWTAYAEGALIASGDAQTAADTTLEVPVTSRNWIFTPELPRAVLDENPAWLAFTVNGGDGPQFSNPDDQMDCQRWQGEIFGVFGDRATAQDIAGKIMVQLPIGEDEITGLDVCELIGMPVIERDTVPMENDQTDQPGDIARVWTLRIKLNLEWRNEIADT